MRVSELVKKLRQIEKDVPFDAELMNFEFGDSGARGLVDIRSGAPFVVLTFGEGQALTTSEALRLLEEEERGTPFDPVVTDGRLGESCNELVRVYHDPPVTILEMGNGLCSE